MKLITRMFTKKQNINSLQTNNHYPERDWLRIITGFTIALCAVLGLEYWIHTHIVDIEFPQNNEHIDVYKKDLVEAQLKYFEENKKIWQKLKNSAKVLLEEMPSSTTGTSTEDGEVITEVHVEVDGTSEVTPPSSEVNIVPSF